MEKSVRPEWDWEVPARQQLELLAESSYRAFSEKLLPGTSHILGAVSYTHLTLPTIA